ncbi:hypothetical protein CUMW_250750 [Citrus unshiu]|uniref:Uncharacterized protein n=1 Tax=Citrus unshiu TaxID=55188 RepID=A0A2H5QPX8_CITUN|nr:hypothetical protein CUMW_250750 [Citrus unshiu]
MASCIHSLINRSDVCLPLLLDFEFPGVVLTRRCDILANAATVKYQNLVVCELDIMFHLEKSISYCRERSWTVIENLGSPDIYEAMQT